MYGQSFCYFLRLLPLLRLLYLLSLLGCAFAQDQASHSVTVALPRLLSVRINDTELLQAPLLITNTTRETPDTTQQLSIRTNGVWTLSASFTSCQPNDLARVSLRAGQLGEVQSLRTYPRVILTGAATGGWKGVPLEGFLEPSVNSCQGKLLYTLTQP
jgi:hypothetical protein